MPVNKLKTSSNRIRSRFFIGLFAVGSIILISILIHLSFTLSQKELDKPFIPTNLVNQTQIVYALITTPQNSATLNFTCGERNRVTLREKIASIEKIDFDQADARLIQIWSDYNAKSSNVSCKNFPEILDAAYILAQLSAANPKLSKETLANQLFSQSLNWNTQVLCVFGKDANGKFIVSGRPGNCGSADIKSNALTSARTNLKDGFAPLLQLAQFRKQSGGSDGIKSLTLSLNPELQLLASNIGKCNDKNPSCNADLFNQLKLTSDLTFTILNANTGALLAVGCYGKSCGLTANYQLGLLAGANIEGPPASTEKLLFSYAFLKNRSVSPTELQFQIKTSGEVDGKVTKRNEWWEKNAICNNGTSLANCSVPTYVTEFAKEIGLNNGCSDTPDRRCGTSRLLEPMGLEPFSPTNGRILVSANKEGPYLDARLIKGPFMPWTQYDEIREGKKRATNFKVLENTSLAIQSVIGAANNRITSYGLATLVSSLYQIASFSTLTQPSLFESQNSIIKKMNGQANAQIILKGMQKVPRPTEKNWAGDGTASKVFTLAFGKPCLEDCPIYAKTGTVSKQDKTYGGNTLFGAIVQVNQLQGYIGAPVTASANSALAIGVLANPNVPGSGHIASKFGMLLIREVIKTNGL